MSTSTIAFVFLGTIGLLRREGLFLYKGFITKYTKSLLVETSTGRSKLMYRLMYLHSVLLSKLRQR